MKKKLNFCAICLAIASIGGMCVSKFYQGDNQTTSLLLENVEALAGSEDVIITCSSGNDGQCFSPGEDFKMCGEFMYYECEYSGYTFDNCSNPC